MGNSESEIVFVQPPMVLPTAVMAGVPSLVGNLEAHGISSTVVDLGIDFTNAVMTAENLSRLLEVGRRRLATLNHKESLTALEVAEFAPLASHVLLEHLPAEIEDAIAIFKDERFYDFDAYYSAARSATEAIGLLSATSFPLEIGYGDMRSRTHDIHRVSSALYDAVDEFDAKDEDNVVKDVLLGLLDEGFAAGPPKLIGISVCYAQQWFFAHWVARELRRRYPDAVIVFGGPTIGKLARKAHERGQWRLFRDADAIAIGDGENVILDMATTVLAGKPLTARDNVILYNRETGRGEMPSIGMLKNLDTVPAADFRCIDLSKYWNPKPFLPLCVARGCYWDKCTFCYFGDVIDPKRITTAYREMSKWSVQARAEKNFKKERTTLLKEGGCEYIFFGLESFDDEVLKAIDKGTTADQYARVLSDFYTSGIATGVMGFFDFPTEDYESARRSLDFLESHVDIVSEINWGFFGLEQGAKVYTDPEAYGIEEIIESSDADLAAMVSYRLKKVMKTPEQDAELYDGLFNVTSKYHNEFLRPFLTGSRCEHSTFYYERFGPGALKLFAAHISKQQAVLASNVPLKLKVGPYQCRYDLLQLAILSRNLMDTLGNAGQMKSGNYEKTKLVSLRSEAPSIEFLARYASWDKEHGFFDARSNEKSFFSSPWKTAAVSEDLSDVLEFFKEPATLKELEAELDQDLAPVLPLLRDALKYGWLGVARPASTDERRR